ncbi:MFS general substrate transporter [Flagelloscypha sp. PMI_526]|nr:MFS general substrate transporter [Flagelloscypha sp. PMI_526]
MSSPHQEVFELPTLSASIATSPLESVDEKPTSSSLYSRTSVPAASSSGLESSEPMIDGRKHRLRAAIQFGMCCWILMLCGWNDGSTGSLLPRIQQVYNVNFTTVSLLFVFACVGYMIGAFANIYLSDRLGFGKTLLLAAALQSLAYALQAPALPFPVFVMAFTINGIGLSLQNAQATGYTASLKDRPSLKMGVMQACYGLGAFASPLVATQFAQMPKWSYHYLVCEALVLTNAVLVFLVFRGKTQEECLLQIGQLPRESNTSEHSKFKQVMNQKTVQLLALFGLVYVGTEVTIGGWIVTFVQELRGGGANAGYVSAGFFGGLMVGRLALLWVNHKIGEHRVIYLYCVLCIGLELIVWFVPSLLSSAISTALVGLLFGPFYPIMMNHSGRVLPHWILTASIGYIGGIGQAGSALIPFFTGAMANKFGIQSLQPFVVSMMASLTFLWWCVPSGPRRVD